MKLNLAVLLLLTILCGTYCESKLPAAEPKPWSYPVVESLNGPRSKPFDPKWGEEWREEWNYEQEYGRGDYAGRTYPIPPWVRSQADQEKYLQKKKEPEKEQVVVIGANALVANNYLDTVQLEWEDEVVHLQAKPMTLRKILFWIGDYHWTTKDWATDKLGRKTFLEYADLCKAGKVTIHRQDYFDPAWPNVKKHLAVDSIGVKTHYPK